MSIPHILFTASGSSGPSAASNDLKKLQSTNSLTAKDNIRERLNMHVKKRIQGHDIIGQYPISQYSMPATSGSSIYTSSASTLKQTHPFLMTGTAKLKLSIHLKHHENEKTLKIFLISK